ncbi:MAG: DUF4234 domain-containing protein [Oscillospiraceae bacterium]|nr:DUF4234 domain-containing protein [Oscillospiraceae bacterium]
MVQRREIFICILLSIVTCGIYSIYWFIKLTNDVNYLSGLVNQTSGGMAFLFTLLTCNIYGLYWAYNMGEKLDMAKKQRGVPASNGGLLFLILQLLCAPAAFAVMQNEINKFAG